MAKGREELCGEARPSSIGPESLREAGGGQPRHCHLIPCQ